MRAGETGYLPVAAKVTCVKTQIGGSVMLKQYTVEYSFQNRKHSPPPHQEYYVDDVVEVENFVQDLLARGMGVHAIKREGAEVPKVEFDRIVKVAAGEVAARLICASLHIKPDEERFRFGFAA
jgi:hypothetical protein